MFRKISLTMAFTYGLIIILTIIVLDTVILITYEKDQVSKNEVKVLWYARILSNIAKNNFDNKMELNGEIRENSVNTQYRVLVLDMDGKVLADTQMTYFGKIISNQQIKNCFGYESESIGYYREDKNNIMMVTVPVIAGKKTIGAVLVSLYIDDIYNDVADLRRQIIVISLVAGLLAIAFSFFTGIKISKPIVKLTQASAEIQKGSLNTRVDIQRYDEIGKLARTFNDMSEEIYKTDTNRRRFIGDVSHELKTPLASIKVLIESLIESDNDIETYKEYLTDINGEIDRLTQLVKSLLSATRLEEFELKKEKLHLQAELKSIEKLFKPLLAQKSILLTINCSDEIIVETDRYMLREILINLIDNSIKYGRYQGYINISCEIDKHIHLSICDNGCGIPESELGNIFNIFYRVDQSRNRDTGGSGIGLYIVNKIVKLSGWEIKVKSRVGMGTEFTIIIK